MAFLNRVSSLVKNTVSKNVNSELFAPSSSLFQAIRSFSSSKVFVGGLSYSTDEASLREAFSKYGDVVDVRVITDRETGRSRGFGFITYTETESASSAIQAFDGQDLHGRRVRVNYATDRPQGGRVGYGGGGGYGGQGGYGGGNQYPSGGGGYGGGNQYPSGGGGNQYPSGGGGYGDSSGFANADFSAGQSGFSAPQESVPGGFGDVEPAVNARDEGDNIDEPNDFANKSG